jgi:hypothetical protein
VRQGRRTFQPLDHVVEQLVLSRGAVAVVTVVAETGPGRRPQDRFGIDLLRVARALSDSALIGGVLTVGTLIVGVQIGGHVTRAPRHERRGADERARPLQLLILARDDEGADHDDDREREDDQNCGHDRCGHRARARGNVAARRRGAARRDPFVH